MYKLYIIILLFIIMDVKCIIGLLYISYVVLKTIEPYYNLLQLNFYKLCVFMSESWPSG